MHIFLVLSDMISSANVVVIIVIFIFVVVIIVVVVVFVFAVDARFFNRTERSRPRRLISFTLTR